MSGQSLSQFGTVVANLAPQNLLKIAILFD
jgi:hypothetical protein